MERGGKRNRAVFWDGKNCVCNGVHLSSAEPGGQQVPFWGDCWLSPSSKCSLGVQFPNQRASFARAGALCPGSGLSCERKLCVHLPCFLSFPRHIGQWWRAVFHPRGGVVWWCAVLQQQILLQPRGCITQFPPVTYYKSRTSYFILPLLYQLNFKIIPDVI